MTIQNHRLLRVLSQVLQVVLIVSYLNYLMRYAVVCDYDYRLSGINDLETLKFVEEKLKSEK